MTTVLEMYRRFKALRESQDHTVGAVEMTSKDLADVNRKQLLAGRRADGDEIHPMYRYYVMPDTGATYESFKHAMNPVPGKGTPDLKLTGAFHNSIKVWVLNGKLSWGASDQKASSLLAKYGPILGVYQNDALEKYKREILLPLSIRIIKAATGTR